MEQEPQQPIIAEEPQQIVEGDKEKLSQAINTVVDYIADKVADKVSHNISNQPSEIQQNGFDSINKAVETMASSGGKKRKSYKFRLTNKNKTRHNKNVH
jgi:hypothetical protein